jgi:hypothetical protein
MLKNETMYGKAVKSGTESREAADDGAGNDKMVNQTYKATVFAMVFREKPALLNLYNAVNGTDYRDSELLTVNTLENAIYTNIHNDVSFLIDSRLSLYEHQSTRNPNMPLRFLMYIADLYSVLVKDKNLYGTRLVPLPTPQFLVFYNGTDEVPEEQFLRLSAAYLIPETEPSLDLVVRMLNINSGYNRKLLESCKELGDYAEFTRLVRFYQEQHSLERAIDLAIDQCIRNGNLKEFLERNRAEVKKVSIYEYDAEKHIQLEREAAREEGWEEGREEGRKVGREEGREEGMALGEAGIILKMHRKGYTIEQIAEIAEKNREEIEKVIIGKEN